MSCYSGETLDEELRLAATGFCEDDANVSVTADASTVRLSMLFEWYRGDFGATDREVLESVRGWCADGSAKQRALREALGEALGDEKKGPNDVGGGEKKKEKKTVRLAYAPYDWSTDATPESRTYASANVRESWGRFTGM